MSAASPDRQSANETPASCRRAGAFLFATGLLGEPSRPGPFSVAPVKRQAKAIFHTLAEEVSAFGASLENTLGLQQYITSRDLAPFYSEERRQHFPKAPTSTTIACSRVGAPDALVQVDAIIALPDAQHAITRDAGTHPSAGYAHTIGFGDWIFCSGVLASAVPSAAAYEGGPGTSVAREARLDPNYWFGFAIKAEIDYILTRKLAAILEKSGTSRENIAFAHIHLLDPVRDLAPFIEIWSQLCPHAVTVISASQGFGAHGACVEVTTIAMRSGGNLQLARIDAQIARPFSLGPVAGRVGDLVFTSLLAAADEHGLAPGARVDRDREFIEQQTSKEMDLILDQVETICAAAGGHLRDVVRLRLYVSSMALAPAAITALRARSDTSIPFSLVEDASLSTWMPGCTVTADAVIHIRVE